MESAEGTVVVPEWLDDALGGDGGCRCDLEYVWGVFGHDIFYPTFTAGFVRFAILVTVTRN